MKIGNIITNKQNLGLESNLSDLFNISEDDINVDFSLPTLIIGFDFVNSRYPDFDICSIKIKENLYWTFKKTEKRDKFSEDINWFISKVLCDLTANINYIFVDPIQYNNRKLLKIVKKILSTNDFITYNHDEMYYLFDGKIIFGIDNNLTNFIGLNKSKVRTLIKNHTTTFLEKNKNVDEFKGLIGYLENKVKYIPLLFLIKNT